MPPASASERIAVLENDMQNVKQSVSDMQSDIKRNNAFQNKLLGIGIALTTVLTIIEIIAMIHGGK